MKILFIPNTYLNLYEDIEDELKKEGHIVTRINEKPFPSSPFIKIGFKPLLFVRRIIWKKRRMFERHWRNLIITDSRLNEFYDLLFVIQGISFSPILIQHLKKINPKIKSSLYIWDSNRMYDFFKNSIYFDKVFSFDFYDVRHFGNGRVKFLPFFWSDRIMQYDDLSKTYLISSIGTNHHSRLHIYKKVIKQIDKQNIPYYIKLVIPNNISKDSRKEKIHYLLDLIMHKRDKIERYKLTHNKLTYPFITHHIFTTIEFYNIMMKSKAILDTDNEMQCGTTPRLIWALAGNKHVYTTNNNIKLFPFYNEKYIHIINRNNPVLDLSFLKESIIDSRKSVEYLRIDNWIKNFL